MTVLTCPKCAADMHTYERNAVTVDQCGGCRGVSLDRGELERLIDAESSFYARSRPEPAPVLESRPPASPARPYDHRTYSEHGYKKRKKSSFLSELFD